MFDSSNIVPGGASLKEEQEGGVLKGITVLQGESPVWYQLDIQLDPEGSGWQTKQIGFGPGFNVFKECLAASAWGCFSGNGPLIDRLAFRPDQPEGSGSVAG